MRKLPFLFLLLRLYHAVAALETDTAKCSATSFTHPSIPGASILSIEAEEKHDVSTSSPFRTSPSVSNLHFCDVQVHLTHAGTNDRVLIRTWLPLSTSDWNGRFVATGGGGWSTGMFEPTLGPAVHFGYAASSTDGGHQSDPGDVSWAVNTDGSINWHLLENLASRSLVDEVLVGKRIAEQYYGTAPHHSYWDGCSQGGRQGYTIAQKYPKLVDGIHACAPALDFVNMAMGSLWPQFVMNNASTLMTQCEFAPFIQAAVEQCDLLDGVRDAIIEDPETCTLDPTTLVGERIQCDGEQFEITPAMADIVNRIHRGPQTAFGSALWHGYPHGTPMNWVANVKTIAEGIRSPDPFAVSSSFIRHLLVKNSAFNISNLSYADYMSLWVQANEDYGYLLNANNPNLQALRDAGGKLLTWHGTSDEVIPYQSTLRYRQRVEAAMGGAKAVNEFYRVFLAPGLGHCGLGNGLMPTDALQALVDWVEEGEAPETLEADAVDARGERMTRELCAYPKKSKYMGIGDGSRASSWACEGGEVDDEDELFDSKRDFVGGLKERLMRVGMDLGLSIG
ncbi:feruloyl esterase B precursor [Sporormia fimetaria CBS 119925]|uniref:Carboxylic ester hydrolase n=1 Tax=Sporormia fimetaria CBS 119925 TaxID=1340428 RepID=A0A6A6UWQ4_9PLEO|nr:feruloyl esterase B precursor [Sporormia fimetaria CBS 119925]